MASRRKAKVSRLEQVLARGELVRAEAEAPGSPRGSFSLPGSPNTSLTTTGPSPSPSIRKDTVSVISNVSAVPEAFQADASTAASKGNISPVPRHEDAIGPSSEGITFGSINQDILSAALRANVAPAMSQADGFTSAFEADIASVAHKVDASSKGGVREGIEQGNKSPTSTVSSAAVGSSVGSLLQGKTAASSHAVQEDDPAQGSSETWGEAKFIQEMEKLMIEILEDSLWASEGLHAAEDAEFEEEIKGLTAEELLVKIVNMSMEAEKDCIELAKMTDAMNKVLKGYDDVGT